MDWLIYRILKRAAWIYGYIAYWQRPPYTLNYMKYRVKLKMVSQNNKLKVNNKVLRKLVSQLTEEVERLKQRG